MLEVRELLSELVLEERRCVLEKASSWISYFDHKGSFVGLGAISAHEIAFFESLEDAGDGCLAEVDGSGQR